MTKWAVVGVVPEGVPIDVGGINPWDHKWRQVEDVPVKLPHPQHGSQLHDMYVYEIEGSMRAVQFAAGELSACVWGFYVPVRHKWLAYIVQMLRRKGPN